MISKGTFLNVNDNSGAILVSCIHIYGKKYGVCGDLILVTIKELRKKRRISTKIKKGSKVKAIITRCIDRKLKSTGFNTTFTENSVVLLGKNNKPIGSRVFGAVSGLIRQTRFLRVSSLSAGFID